MMSSPAFPAQAEQCRGPVAELPSVTIPAISWHGGQFPLKQSQPTPSRSSVSRQDQRRGAEISKLSTGTSTPETWIKEGCNEIRISATNQNDEAINRRDSPPSASTSNLGASTIAPSKQSQPRSGGVWPFGPPKINLKELREMKPDQVRAKISERKASIPASSINYSDLAAVRQMLPVQPVSPCAAEAIIFPSDAEPARRHAARQQRAEKERQMEKDLTVRLARTSERYCLEREEAREIVFAAVKAALKVVTKRERAPEAQGDSVFAAMVTANHTPGSNPCSSSQLPTRGASGSRTFSQRCKASSGYGDVSPIRLLPMVREGNEIGEDERVALDLENAENDGDEDNAASFLYTKQSSHAFSVSTSASSCPPYGLTMQLTRQPNLRSDAQYSLPTGPLADTASVVPSLSRRSSLSGLSAAGSNITRQTQSSRGGGYGGRSGHRGWFTGLSQMVASFTIGLCDSDMGVTLRDNRSVWSASSVRSSVRTSARSSAHNSIRRVGQGVQRVAR